MTAEEIDFKAAKEVEDNDLGSRLLCSIFPGQCESASSIKVDTESKYIARILDSGNTSMAAELLSSDLMKLDRKDYNLLLREVNKKEGNGKGADLSSGNWNQQAGSWDSIRISPAKDDLSSPAYRIVQPGETLAKIAAEELEKMSPGYSDEQYSQYLSTMAFTNSLQDGKYTVEPGKAIRVFDFERDTIPME